jgi:hypothetical protein
MNVYVYVCLYKEQYKAVSILEILAWLQQQQQQEQQQQNKMANKARAIPPSPQHTRLDCGPRHTLEALRVFQ